VTKNKTFLLLVDSLELVIKSRFVRTNVVGELLHGRIPHQDYVVVPLALAVRILSLNDESERLELESILIVAFRHVRLGFTVSTELRVLRTRYWMTPPTVRAPPLVHLLFSTSLSRL
jgi:hypothetical protein